MAPYAVQSARSGQPNTNRPAPAVPRVVPAIPKALTKASRPRRTATPEHSEPATDPNQAAGNYKAADGSGAVDDANCQLTPASSASSANNTGAHRGDGNDDDSDGNDNEHTVTGLGHGLGNGLSSDGQKRSTEGPAESQTDSSTVQSPDRSASGSSESRGYTNPGLPLQRTVDGSIADPPPPPFQPDIRSTPSSVTSPTLPPGLSAINDNLRMYHPRPIPRGLAFGGHPDSSSTSPVPPLSAGAPRFPLPPQGFALANAASPAFIPSVHTRHVAESQSHMLYPPSQFPAPTALPLRYPPPPPSFNRAHGWITSGAPGGFLPGYSPPQTSPREAVFGNGTGPSPRSLSFGSTGEHGPPSQPPSERVSMPQDQPRASRAHSNGSGTQSNTGIAQRAVNQSAAALAHHMQATLEAQEFADVHLELAINPLVSVTTHALIASRSPRIGHLLYSQRPSYNERGMRTVKFGTRDRFIRSHAFLHAFRYLYGAPLLTVESFGGHIPPYTRESHDESVSSVARQRMEHALAYTAVGRLLEVPEILASGIECAKQLVRWDTIEQALAFALDGGVDPALEANWSNSGHNVHSTKERDVPSPAHHPTYGDFSSDLLDAVLQFLVLELPDGFVLDTDAAQLGACPRLPISLDSRPSISDPRLSRLRFGEVPLEEFGKGLYSTTLLSSILISLPFPLLKGVLEHPALTTRLGRDSVLRIIQNVVEEREERRSKVLKSRRVSVTATGSEQDLWLSIPWEERVEPFHDCDLGFTLERRWNSEIQLPATVNN